MKQLEYDAKWRRKNAKEHSRASSDWQKKNPEKARAKQAKWLANNPEKRLLQNARARAKQKSLEFSIDITDVVIPKLCPIFLVPLEKGTAYAPSIDRIDSSKGYVKGNVWVISWKANKIKSDASLEVLERLVFELRKLQGET